jgi:hypothetical protein
MERIAYKELNDLSPQMLLESSNQGGWDGKGKYHAWERSVYSVLVGKHKEIYH